MKSKLIVVGSVTLACIVGFLLAGLVGIGTLANPDSVQKWEYLVVTPGKVYWCSGSSYGCPLEKVIGMGFRREAVECEKLLDEAGQMGWELVTVVGQIGGDQEFIFKRPVSP